MPPSLEELLYQRLIRSPAFNAWVKRIHGRINRIPLEEQTFDPQKTNDININAFRIIFVDELKKAFTFK
ncbi:hypothetical protein METBISCDRAFT_25527 [Metschnikowia bicuspidata]|uniref:Uncharacterized protein n=1 Tax=Metschnikowia bicuspidata TaxID=27322 RepID=A0A4P9ZHE9_9ASCO|nr:hypothetical protein METBISCDRAFT_25527 [Metschnikowia bicuspidata]